MKLDKKLATILKSVKGRKKNCLPILKNVLIEKNVIYATDLDVSFRQKLSESIPDGIYEFIGNNLEKTKIFIEEYPTRLLCPTLINEFDTEIFVSMFEKAFSVSSLDDVRYTLKSVLMRIKTEEQKIKVSGVDGVRIKDKHKVILAGTDGRRLFVDNFENTCKLPETKDFIIGNPRRLVKLFKYMQSDRIKLFVNIKQNIIEFTDGFRTVQTVLIEGVYPKYEQVFPEVNKLFTFNTKCAICALKELMPYICRSDNKDSTIKIIHKENVLTFSLNSEEFDKSFDIPVTKKDGSKPKTGFLLMPLKGCNNDKNTLLLNAQYLLEILQGLKQPSISLGVKDELNELCAIHIS